jgi:hypothetical protein
LPRICPKGFESIERLGQKCGLQGFHGD